MTPDTTKMKVEDIRRLLVNDYGVAISEVDAVKGKANLVALLAQLSDTAVEEDVPLHNINLGQGDDLGDAELVVDTVGPVDYIPTNIDPEWHDYVMQAFTPDELVKGNPTTDGMRRVAERLVDDIVSIIPNIKQVPDENNGKRASVEVLITTGSGRVYGGAADCYWGNTDAAYRNYPVAVAETRAEGRALKRMLRLRKVISAEEAASELEDLSGNSSEMINDHQIQALDMQSKSRDINLAALIKHKYSTISNVRNMKHQQALELFGIFNEYQQKGIPEQFVGYSKNWESQIRE